MCEYVRTRYAYEFPYHIKQQSILVCSAVWVEPDRTFHNSSDSKSDHRRIYRSSETQIDFKALTYGKIFGLANHACARFYYFGAATRIIKFLKKSSKTHPNFPRKTYRPAFNTSCRISNHVSLKESLGLRFFLLYIQGVCEWRLGLLMIVWHQRSQFPDRPFNIQNQEIANWSSQVFPFLTSETSSEAF